MAFPATVMTPEAVAFRGEVDALVARGWNGYLGVLDGHAPMVCALSPGTLTLRQAEEETLAVVGRGVLKVEANVALLLVDVFVPVADSIEAESRLEEYLASCRPPAAPFSKPGSG